jgi:hypothetical protein
VYLTAKSAEARHFLLDDLTSEKLAGLKETGFFPAFVLESSPGNLQAVLNARKPKLAADELEKDAANRVFREINQKFGDKNISGALHPFRLPGTWNWKLNRRLPDGNPPGVALLEAESKIIFCQKTEILFQEKIKEAKKEIENRPHRTGEAAKRETVRTDSFVPAEVAYHKLNEDLNNQFGSPDDYSSRDARLALALRVLGHSQEEVQNALETEAWQIRPPQKQKDHNWADYAKRTAAYAYGERGDIKYEKLRSWKEKYKKIVGGGGV